MERNDPRAMIERGTIVSAENNAYKIKSLDRNGIITPPLKTIGGSVYELNAAVYFFLFDDGTGAVIAEA